MNPRSRNLLAIILLLISTSAFASDSSYVHFIFPDSLPAGKFTITVYDGIREHRINPKNTQHWRGKLLAPYGLSILGYPDTDTTFVTTKVFFKKGHSEVSLISSLITGQYYALDKKSSVNIVPYNELGGAAFEAFINERQDTLMAYYHRSKHYFGKDKLLVEKAFVLSDSLLAKKIEFTSSTKRGAPYTTPPQHPILI